MSPSPWWWLKNFLYNLILNRTDELLFRICKFSKTAIFKARLLLNHFFLSLSNLLDLTFLLIKVIGVFFVINLSLLKHLLFYC